jgi:hypothetical protein
MAKRARGSSTRPGQRPPLQRSTPGRPMPAPGAADGATPAVRPATLTQDEEARAAALEAQIVAEEKAAERAARRAREARRAGSLEPVGRGSLATQAAEEYAYVARDLRRIAVIGGGLLAILIGFWAVLQATGTTLI